MSARRECGTRLIALLALGAAPAAAQQPAGQPQPAGERPDATGAPAARTGWTDRLSVAVRGGQFRPRGGGQAFALFDLALVGSSEGALRPPLVGAELRLDVRRRWTVVLGSEAGEGTRASISRVGPTTGGAIVQQTSFALTGVHSAGVEWQAWRWRGGRAGAADRLRLFVGAGAGVARYRLHQRGEFVDAERRVAFADDFRSAGEGAIGHASAAVELPLARWLAVRGDVRRQVGSARMTDDFAAFDRLDLGGTRLGAAVVLRRGGAVR